jgi:hypothetical protein
LRCLREYLDEGDVIEILARGLRDQAHQHHAPEIHLEVAHHREHPQVGFLAGQHVLLDRRGAAGDDHRLLLAIDALAQQGPQPHARLAALKAHHFGAALAGAPQVGYDRKFRRLAVHVERVVELHRRVLAAQVEHAQQPGDVEVHRVDGAAHRPEFGRVIANLVEIGGKALGCSSAARLSTRLLLFRHAGPLH